MNRRIVPPSPEDLGPLENCTSIAFVTNQSIPATQRVRVACRTGYALQDSLIRSARKLYEEGKLKDSGLRYHLASHFYDPFMAPLPGFPGWEHNPAYPMEYPRRIDKTAILKYQKLKKETFQQKKIRRQSWLKAFWKKRALKKTFLRVSMINKKKKLSEVRSRPLFHANHDIGHLNVFDEVRKYDRVHDELWKNTDPLFYDKVFQSIRIPAKSEFEKEEELAKQKRFEKVAREWLREHKNPAIAEIEKPKKKNPPEDDGFDLVKYRKWREEKEAKEKARQFFKELRKRKKDIQPNPFRPLNDSEEEIMRVITLMREHREKQQTGEDNIELPEFHLTSIEEEEEMLLTTAPGNLKSMFDGEIFVTSSEESLEPVIQEMRSAGVTLEDCRQCKECIDDIINLTVCQEVIPQLVTFGSHKDPNELEHYTFNFLRPSNHKSLWSQLRYATRIHDARGKRNDKMTLFALLQQERFWWTFPLHPFIRAKLAGEREINEEQFRRFEPSYDQPIELFKLFLSTNIDEDGRRTKDTDKFMFYSKKQIRELFDEELERLETSLTKSRAKQYHSIVLNEKIDSPFARESKRFMKRTYWKAINGPVDSAGGKYQWRENPIDLRHLPRFDDELEEEKLERDIREVLMEKEEVTQWAPHRISDILNFRVSRHPRMIVERKNPPVEQRSKLNYIMHCIKELDKRAFYCEKDKEAEKQKLLAQVDAEKLEKMQVLIKREPGENYVGFLESRDIRLKSAAIRRVESERRNLTKEQFRKAREKAAQLDDDGAGCSWTTEDHRNPPHYKTWDLNDFQDVKPINMLGSKEYPCSSVVEKKSFAVDRLLMTASKCLNNWLKANPERAGSPLPEESEKLQPVEKVYTKMEMRILSRYLYYDPYEEERKEWEVDYQPYENNDPVAVALLQAYVPYDKSQHRVVDPDHRVNRLYPYLKAAFQFERDRELEPLPEPEQIEELEDEPEMVQEFEEEMMEVAEQTPEPEMINEPEPSETLDSVEETDESDGSQDGEWPDDLSYYDSDEDMSAMIAEEMVKIAQFRPPSTDGEDNGDEDNANDPTLRRQNLRRNVNRHLNALDRMNDRLNYGGRFGHEDLDSIEPSNTPSESFEIVIVPETSTTDELPAANAENAHAEARVDLDQPAERTARNTPAPEDRVENHVPPSHLRRPVTSSDILREARRIILPSDYLHRQVKVEVEENLDPELEDFEGDRSPSITRHGTPTARNAPTEDEDIRRDPLVPVLAEEPVEEEVVQPAPKEIKLETLTAEELAAIYTGTLEDEEALIRQIGETNFKNLFSTELMYHERHRFRGQKIEIPPIRIRTGPAGPQEPPRLANWPPATAPEPVIEQLPTATTASETEPIETSIPPKESSVTGARRRKQGAVKKKDAKLANELIAKEWDELSSIASNFTTSTIPESVHKKGQTKRLFTGTPRSSEDAFSAPIRSNRSSILESIPDETEPPAKMKKSLDKTKNVDVHSRISEEPVNVREAIPGSSQECHEDQVPEASVQSSSPDLFNDPEPAVRDHSADQDALTPGPETPEDGAICLLLTDERFFSQDGDQRVPEYQFTSEELLGEYGELEGPVETVTQDVVSEEPEVKKDGKPKGKGRPKKKKGPEKKKVSAEEHAPARSPTPVEQEIPAVEEEDVVMKAPSRKRKAVESTDASTGGRATRSKRLFLSKNNPTPRVRREASDTQAEASEPVRLTGIAVKGSSKSPGGTPEKLKHLPKAIQRMVEDDERSVPGVSGSVAETVQSADNEIKTENQEDESWVPPPPIKTDYRISRKRKRQEKNQEILDEIKEECEPQTGEFEVVMSNLQTVKQEEDDVDDVQVVQANFKVKKHLVQLENETLQSKTVEVNEDGRLTHSGLVTKRIWEGVNELFMSDPQKFSEICLILLTESGKRGRVLKFESTVADRTAKFDPKFIKFLAESPKEMSSEMVELTDYSSFSSALREKASHLLTDHKITPFILHQLVEKISEMRKSIREGCPSGVLADGDRDALHSTEHILIGAYIQTVMTMTAHSQLTWATETHVKRRLELIYHGWKMFLCNGGFFRVLLALNRDDVRAISPKFREFCQEYLEDIEKNYAKAEELYKMSNEQLVNKLREDSKVTAEQMTKLDADMRSEPSASHPHKCSRCFINEQPVYFSSYSLLSVHEKFHEADTHECGRCYDDYTGPEIVLHRINHHLSLRLQDD